MTVTHGGQQRPTAANGGQIAANSYALLPLVASKRVFRIDPLSLARIRISGTYAAKIRWIYGPFYAAEGNAFHKQNTEESVILKADFDPNFDPNGYPNGPNSRQAQSGQNALEGPYLLDFSPL